MFEHDSRYSGLDNLEYQDARGRVILYRARRFPQPGSSYQTARMVKVMVGDRLDLIAERSLGDSQRFWRIADANDALNPFDLLEEGARLRIPAVSF